MTEVSFAAMATQIMPERFSGGDFTTWLRHFARCSAANAWDDATRLLKLPAFLHGPAALYFDSLAEEEKDTLPHLLASLQQCFTPAADREKFYRDFEQQALRTSEDPSLYLWRLKDLLRHAEPDLSADAFNALLRRQFMKGLPFPLRMKLLESDPTPDLAKMVSFAHRFRALDELPVGNPASCAAVHSASSDPAVSQPDFHAVPDHMPHKPHEEQQQRLDKLEHLVSNMAEQQATLLAAVSSLSSHPITPSSPFNSKVQAPHNLRCFYCHEEGHIVRNCWKRRNASRCQICSGWGHSPENCATASSMNNSNPHQPNRKSQYSLNFQRVPR